MIPVNVAMDKSVFKLQVFAECYNLNRDTKKNSNHTISFLRYR